MEYKLLTGFSIPDYNVIFNILSISHDNIKILPLKYCSTIILTTNASIVFSEKSLLAYEVVHRFCHGHILIRS